MSEPVPPSTDARGDSERALEPWPRWTSELHESLASQEASASELRQELDDLRRTLDAAPAAEQARGRRAPPRAAPHARGGGGPPAAWPSRPERAPSWCSASASASSPGERTRAPPPPR